MTQQINLAWKERHLKDLYKLINKYGAYEENMLFAEYVIKDDIILSKNDSIKEFTAYYKSLFNQRPFNSEISLTERLAPTSLYTLSNVKEAIERLSLNKAVSSDYFPDTLLKRQKYYEKAMNYVTDILNGKTSLGEYLATGRLLLLSKKDLICIAPMETSANYCIIFNMEVD